MLKKGKEDYYSLRKKAYQLIEIIIQKSKVIDLDTIYYEIAREFGFGETIVKKYLILLHNKGIIKLSDLDAIWIKPDIKTFKEVQEKAEVEFLLKEQQYTPAATKEPIPKSKEPEQEPPLAFDELKREKEGENAA